MMETPMNWITAVVRPKIRSLLRRETTENLWIKCPETGQLVFHKDVEANLWVIPGSNHHMRITAAQRLSITLDPGSQEDVPLPDVPLDPLRFRDEKRYTDRLKEARAKTGLQDAVKVAHGTLEGQAVTVAVQDFHFMGGSLGMAAAEAIVTAAEAAISRHTPLILFASGGGMRMQEGMLVADADAAHDGRRAPAARGAAALYRGADRSDHGRRDGLLCDAWGRAYRRARRSHRLCRPARHRADDPREAA